MLSNSLNCLEFIMILTKDGSDSSCLVIVSEQTWFTLWKARKGLIEIEISFYSPTQSYIFTVPFGKGRQWRGQLFSRYINLYQKI